MSRLLALVLLLATAMPAGAISRYSATGKSCTEIASIIREEGAAIFRYPSPRRAGFTLFDRYVRNRTYCSRHQSLEKVYIPSTGGDQCLVQRCSSNPVKDP